MSSRGVCDARCQAFHTTMIKREEATRLKWFLKHQQQLLDRLEKSKTAEGIKLPSEERKQPTDQIIHLNPLPNWRPFEPDDSINMDIMKPIKPQIKSILYENETSFITADNYIRERVKKLPEERYYYPDCTSWVHGWRLSDHPRVPRSKVGQKSVMVNEFYHPRVSSLQRDPEWYRPCQRTPIKCNNNTMN